MTHTSCWPVESEYVAGDCDGDASIDNPGDRKHAGHAGQHI